MIVLLLGGVRAAAGQICALQRYSPPGAGIPVRISASGPGEVMLHDPRFDGAVASARVDPGDADLRSLFPDLEALMSGPILRAQLTVGGEEVGPALVIEPLRPVPAARDAWSARIRRAIESGDRGAIDWLVRMPERARDALRRTIETDEPAEPGLAAIRTYEECLIVFRTTAGLLTAALRADAAPRTAHHVRSLAEAGYFNGTEMGRVDDADGRPVAMQCGDPAGGGAGVSVPFERGILPQRFGVVSLVRVPEHPDGGATAIVIWLREEDSSEVEFTGFGEIVEGEATLRALLSPLGRSVTVLDAGLIPAPPVGRPRSVVRALPSERAKDRDEGR